MEEIKYTSVEAIEEFFEMKKNDFNNSYQPSRNSPYNLIMQDIATAIVGLAEVISEENLLNDEDECNIKTAISVLSGVRKELRKMRCEIEVELENFDMGEIKIESKAEAAKAAAQ